MEVHSLEEWNNLGNEFFKQKVILTCRECTKTFSKTYNPKRDTFQELCPGCKAKKTFLKKYGIESPLNIPENRRKCIEKLNSKETKERKKKTCIDRYGVENPSQSVIIKAKKKKTCQEHFNTDTPFQAEEIKEKTKSQYMSKYGTEWYVQTDEFKNKFKQTCLDRYGVESPSSLDTVKEKNRKTCLDRYGVEHYSQSKEAAKTHRSKYKYDNTYFDSSWELAYYIWLKDNNIEFEYQCEPIEYYDNGKLHLYFPDFKVNNQYIEIKGPQFFTESGQFVNPFDRSEETDNHNKRKYECMQANNVIILTDVSEQLRYIDTNYGIGYLKSFKEE